MTSATSKCRPTRLLPRLGRVVDVIHVVLAAWSGLVHDCLPAIVVFRPDDDDDDRSGLNPLRSLQLTSCKEMDRLV